MATFTFLGDNTKYLPIAGGSLIGGLSGTNATFSEGVYASTATAGASSTQLATTAFVYDGLASGTAVASKVIALVTNADTVALPKGTVVYSYGSQGDKVSVKRASSSAESTSSKAFGFVNENIDVNQTGYVTLYGTVEGLSFPSPYVAGDVLWLGTTPGTYTRDKPTAPNHLVFLGIVERANNGNGTAYIKIQNGYELNEIHDVLITSVSARQVLQRSDDNTLWLNKTPLFQDSEISNSGIWNNTTTTVQNNSAVNWNYQGTDLKVLSGNWENTYSTVRNTSANWDIVYSDFQRLSSTFLTSETDSQTLSFDESLKQLSISNGNNVSLSALVDSKVELLSANWQNTYSTVQSNSADWSSVYSNVQSNSANSVSVYSNVQSASANWNSVYSNVQEASASYVTLSATQTLTNKTVVDWMGLVRGFKTTPVLNATITGGTVYTYVYTSSPSDKTYYRFIATDGSEDSFYASFNGTNVSNLIARKGITV